MKNLFFIIFLLGSFNAFAQGKLNEYKYIIVPKKFDAFKRENQYKTSTLVKYLFSKEGFKTVYDDALPEELNSNRCLGLLVSINDKSSLFTTKASIALKDCFSQEIFVTQVGNSKVKEFTHAYNEALTEAFASIKELDYEYVPKTKNDEPITVSFKNDVKKVEAKEMKEPKNKVDNTVVKQKATPEKQLYKDNRPIGSHIKKTASLEKMADAGNENIAILYAQQIPNGFQLVDHTPRIRIKMFKSSMPNYFLAEAENKNGIVYEKDGRWYFEYYEMDNLKTEKLNIKF